MLSKNNNCELIVIMLSPTGGLNNNNDCSILNVTFLQSTTPEFIQGGLRPILTKF